MSVPTSERKENTMKYVKEGYHLYLLVCDVFKPIEDTDKYKPILMKMKELTNEYFVEAAKADDYFLGEFSSKDIYHDRKNHLMNAHAAITTFRYQLNLLYSLVKTGDSRLGNKADRDKKFQRVANSAILCSKLTKGVMDSDEQRWKTWHPSRKYRKKQ